MQLIKVEKRQKWINVFKIYFKDILEWGECSTEQIINLGITRIKSTKKTKKKGKRHNMPDLLSDSYKFFIEGLLVNHY